MRVFCSLFWININSDSIIPSDTWESSYTQMAIWLAIEIQMNKRRNGSKTPKEGRSLKRKRRSKFGFFVCLPFLEKVLLLISFTKWRALIVINIVHANFVVIMNHDHLKRITKRKKHRLWVCFFTCAVLELDINFFVLFWGIPSNFICNILCRYATVRVTMC